MRAVTIRHVVIHGKKAKGAARLFFFLRAASDAPAAPTLSKSFAQKKESIFFASKRERVRRPLEIGARSMRQIR